MGEPTIDRLRQALASDPTVEIVTRGARTGMQRTTEIWCTLVGSEVYICGTPSNDGSPGPREPRDWVANLKANPEFVLRLEKPVLTELPARAEVVTDGAERTRVFSAPETRWYREQAGSLRRLVEESPLVRVTLTGGPPPPTD